MTLALDGISQEVAGLSTANAPATAGGYSIVGANATASTLVVNNAASVSFDGVIGGAGTIENNIALTKTGAGILTLTGTNTYTGATSINVGAVSLEATNAIAANSAVNVATGAALRITAPGSATFSYGFPLTLNGNRGSTSAGLLFPSNNLNTYNVNGTIALNGGGNIYSFGLINTYNLNGVISGTGGLTVTNGGNTNTPQKYVFGAASTYTGDTILATTSGNTIFQLGVSNALPTTTTLAVNGGSAANYAALSLAGNDQTVAGLSGNANARIYGANATLSTLTVNNMSAGTFDGTIGGVGSNENNLALTKSGAGTLTISGTNTYTGATTISDGTLAINGDQSAATGAVTVASSSTLGGSGIIGGATVISNNAIHAPGNSPGVQTFNSTLTYNDGSIFAWDLDTAQANPETNRGIAYDGVNIDQVNLMDGGSTGGSVYSIVLEGSQTFADTFWDNSRNWSDIFKNQAATTNINWSSIFTSFTYSNANGSLDPSSQGSFSFTPSNTLSWSAVPEPSSALAGVLLALGILRRRRG